MELNYFLKKDIIIFGSHYDDIELGVGGMIAKYGHNINTNITLVVATHNNNERLKEQLASYEYLKNTYCSIKELLLLPFSDGTLRNNFDVLRHKIEDILYADNKQYLCLTHFPLDTHIDHRTLSNAVNDAARELSVLYYQSPSSYDFIPNLFTPISRDLLDEKIKMVKFHQSQIDKNNGLFLNKIIASASYHAMNIYEDYAEAYHIHKLKLN